MTGYNYWEDDKNKVVPLATGEHEYIPEDDDIPVDFWKKKDDITGIKYDAKSGKTHLLKVPRSLRFPVVDEDGNPLPEQIYRIYLPSGKILLGKTDQQGILAEKIEEAGDLIIQMENGFEISVELQ